MKKIKIMKGLWAGLNSCEVGPQTGSLIIKNLQFPDLCSSCQYMGIGSLDRVTGLGVDGHVGPCHIGGSSWALGVRWPQGPIVLELSSPPPPSRRDCRAPGDHHSLWHRAQQHLPGMPAQVSPGSRTLVLAEAWGRGT